ncbi:MAG: PilZ domain-containing protein [Vibrio sp.]
MDQSDVLSFAERLIPAYNSRDFESLLDKMTQDEAPSAKILIKMELSRIMAPCHNNVDLRGKVDGVCREYQIDDFTHYLDDIALNTYHKNIKKFGSYTYGVWNALNNTRNNYRVMQRRTQDSTNVETNAYEVEPIRLGYDLKRMEKRLRLSTHIEVKIPTTNIVIHGESLDLSVSGARFKVPSCFKYKSEQIIKVKFVELNQRHGMPELDQYIEYKIIGLNDAYRHDSVTFLRAVRVTKTDIIGQVITESLTTIKKQQAHDNQDKIARLRSRAYEHIFLKHSCGLPLFFNKDTLQLALVTENNREIWQYWHDERNQQTLDNLFTPKRMAALAKSNIKECSVTIYAFKHELNGKTLFFSLLKPEVKDEVRQLFWHVGAQRDTWKVFRLTMFMLSKSERETLASHDDELQGYASQMSHYGVLQEIGDIQSADDYLLQAKPSLPTKTINAFCHPRTINHAPMGIHFDACSRRREPRYQFRTPIEIYQDNQLLATGVTVDISKHGLNITLKTPVNLTSEVDVTINFIELQLYNSKLALDRVPYRTVRISPEGRYIQLMIHENSETVKVTAFLQSIIDHNKTKIIEKPEVLPSIELLEGLHSILLSKLVSTPIYIEKQSRRLKPKVIGIKLPLPQHLELFDFLGTDDTLSLDSIYKNHTNTLMATPMRHIEGLDPQWNELYVSVSKFANRIQAVEVHLHSDFKDAESRLDYVKQAKNLGELLVLRIASTPVINSKTQLLSKDIEEMSHIDMRIAAAIDKEVNSITGYNELIDITDEVLMRLPTHQDK